MLEPDYDERLAACWGRAWSRQEWSRYCRAVNHLG